VFTFQPGQFSPDSLLYQPKPPTGMSYLPGSGGAAAYSATWSFDQRGYPRVANGAADIGAVEVQQSVVRVTDNAGSGSLRQVLTDVYPPGIVTFAPSLSGQTITLTSGQLTLSKSMTIDASSLPGGIQISGNNSSRVMEIAANNTITLDSLTLKNGRVTGANLGGGILIDNGAVLTVNRSTIAGNVAAGGGGIYCNQATLTLNSSTLSGNHAAGFLAGGNGGGLFAYNSSVLVNQSTLSGNSFTPVLNSGAGGGLTTYGSSVTLQNSIVAGNSTPDVGTLNGASPSGPNNLIGGNPLVAPLGNYGGPTQTMPPLPGSPATDGCIGGTSFTIDQRGKPRIIGAFADIGAVEGVFNPAFPLVNVTTPGNGNVQFSFNNLSGLSFTVLASTNVAAPLNTWVNLGPAVEAPPGTFHFIDLQVTNYPYRFYQVRGQ
jgi:hypothetical protein